MSIKYTDSILEFINLMLGLGHGSRAVYFFIQLLIYIIYALSKNYYYFTA